jgi:hypothetical protein
MPLSGWNWLSGAPMPRTTAGERFGERTRRSDGLVDIPEAEPVGQPFAAAFRGDGQILDRIRRQISNLAQGGQELSPRSRPVARQPLAYTLSANDRAFARLFSFRDWISSRASFSRGFGRRFSSGRSLNVWRSLSSRIEMSAFSIRIETQPAGYRAPRPALLQEPRPPAGGLAPYARLVHLGPLAHQPPARRPGGGSHHAPG